MAQYRRHFLKMFGAACVVAPFVAGCGFQPLYGPTASGTSLVEVMKQVSISKIPGRVGQRIRNELIYASTGGGEAAVPEYRLEIAIRESIKDTLVTKEGEPEGRIYQLTAAFKLIRIADKQVLLEGKSYGRAAFDNLTSTFADVRARRDAENRAARAVAGDIQTRVAAVLSRAA